MFGWWCVFLLEGSRRCLFWHDPEARSSRNNDKRLYLVELDFHLLTWEGALSWDGCVDSAWNITSHFRVNISWRRKWLHYYSHKKCSRLLEVRTHEELRYHHGWHFTLHMPTSCKPCRTFGHAAGRKENNKRIFPIDRPPWLHWYCSGWLWMWRTVFGALRCEFGKRLVVARTPTHTRYMNLANHACPVMTRLFARSSNSRLQQSCSIASASQWNTNMAQHAKIASCS